MAANLTISQLPATVALTPASIFPVVVGGVTQQATVAQLISLAGIGTVTSVSLTAPSELTVGGSPVTTSGTLTLSWANQTQNKIFASPNGGSGTPGFRALVAADMPVGTGTVTSIAQSFTGGLISVAGSPVTTSGTLALTVAGTSGGIPYFSGAATWASSAVLAANQLVLGGGVGTTPATLGSLGTTTTVLHGNAAGAPTFGAVSLTTDVSGNLPVTNLNSGTSAGANTVWHGNATWAAVANADLANSSITFNGTAVALGASGTLTLASANFANQGTTTTVLHGNAAGNPSFGAIVNSDITNATIDLTTKVTGILPSANGGTGINNSKNLTVSAALTLAGTDSTTMTFPPASASVGYLNIPQNSQSAAYTTVLADSGKHIFHPTADNNPRTFTIDSNANVAYAVGTAITFINQINTVTIAITSDTLTLAGAGTTGSRTLAANGVATAVKIASTSWIISGTGLT